VITPAAGTKDPSGFYVSEKETSLQDITHYNNFYEFSTDKEGGGPGGDWI
jgi:hypothetical protein